MNAVGLSLSMTMDRLPFGKPRRSRPTLRTRIKTWLARKSRACLVEEEKALLDRLPAATGEVLVLDGMRGLHAGRMARLAAAADGSVDAVVSVAAMAEAPEVAQLLAEIKRVLRPGGRLLFVEPTAAPAGSRLRRLQRMFDGIFRFLAGSVRAPRDLWNDLKTARFGGLTYEHVTVPSLGRLPVPHIVGSALRTGVDDVRHTPLPSRRPVLLDPGTTQPAYAFFG